jgi:uncharacterized repeat protein (TIGR03803 family)
MPKSRSIVIIAVVSLWVLLGLASSPALAQVASTVYSFGVAGDGVAPTAGLIMDASGNLYGTTNSGGSGTRPIGTVFELINNSGTYNEKVLYSFQFAGSDGVVPSAGLIMDAGGDLFGTTTQGGAFSSGTVFELVNSSGTYTEKVLYSFTNSGGDGRWPAASLIMDAAGNLYGTTYLGGASNAGTVFELVNSGGGSYTENVLYSFGSSSVDGQSPFAGLVVDTSGNLYGTTAGGGANGFGTVFELVNNSGTYVEKVLYSFMSAGGDGANPVAGLIMDTSGNMYGTTANGGTSGFGTVFELINNSGTYTDKVLYSFMNTGGDGTGPAGLIMDASGNLYGTTSGGGSGTGTVFELINNSGTWSESVLLVFGCMSYGSNPQGNLLIDAAGNLYGTTSGGGANGSGTVFRIAHSTSSNATTTTLMSSANPVGAGYPVSIGATVTASAGFPAGTLVLSNWLGQLGTTQLACGVATFSFEDALTLGIGSVPITAQYTPAGPDFKASNTAIVQTVTEPGVVVSNGNNTLTGNDTINGSVTTTGTVSASTFIGNGSGLTGVAAAGLNCAGCIGNSQLGINYAGSTSQDGAANSALSATNALMLGGFLPSSFLLSSVLGQPNGVASLDANGKVPAAQLPAAGSSGPPAILSGWCSGAVASSKGATFSFAGLGAAVGNAGTACNNGTGATIVVGIPVTSAGTLANLQVYPGRASSAGTSLTFTVYKAAAPGWTFTTGPNQTTIGALSFARLGTRVTLTVAAGASFASGDQISVSGISGTYNAGTNCTALSGALFDGTFTVSSSTATTVVYTDSSLPTNCGSNINNASASGTVADNTNPTTSNATKTAPTATALTCTIGAPSGSASLVCSDASHAVPVSAGDVISVVGTSARASGAETIGEIRVSLEKH